jgi:ADP-ribose pyrophosphatase
MEIEKKIRTLGQVYARAFSINLDEVSLPSGRVTERIRVNHPDASAIVPILEDGRILFVKQYRYSIQEETIELPAGKMDPGEDPETCIRREFEEETGYTVGDVEFLLKFAPAIGYSSEILYLYKGTGIKKIESTPHSDEISSVLILSLDQIRDKIRSFQIKDGKTLIGLYTLFSDDLLRK